MTYGQRIELGKIFASEILSEFEKFNKTIICLHGVKPQVRQIPKLMEYFKDIMVGLAHWAELENTLLHYDPTSEELEAGINELSKNIGEMSTITGLAKAYGKDPDTILGWEYSKVFGFLYADLETYKFRVKHDKILSRKYVSGH